MELAELTASHKGLAQASHLFLSYISLYTNAGTPSAREERFGEGGQRAKGPRTDGRRQGPRPVPLHSHQEPELDATVDDADHVALQRIAAWDKSAALQAVSVRSLCRKHFFKQGGYPGRRLPVAFAVLGGEQ